MIGISFWGNYVLWYNSGFFSQFSRFDLDLSPKSLESKAVGWIEGIGGGKDEISDCH